MNWKLCVVVFGVAVSFRIEEVFRTQGIFVDAVDGVGRGKGLALGLTLGFFDGAGNIELDLDLDFGVKPDRNIVQANGLDRRVQVNLAAADAEAFGGEDFDHVTGSNRTVKLAGFASRTNDVEGLAGQNVGDLLDRKSVV